LNPDCIFAGADKRFDLEVLLEHLEKAFDLPTSLVVRVDKTVRDCALLIAYGVQENGSRRVLGVSVELSEAEVHWRNFLNSLVKRGLCGLTMITSDNHAGLKAARMSVFPSVPWQRCQFHLQQNASAYVPKKSMQEAVHADIRNVFNMPSKEEAERLLSLTVAKYQDQASDLSQWLESDLAEGFTVFEAAPPTARKKLRTTNMVEFQNKELKKRTRCIRVFPNKDSLLRVVTALLIELDETWQTETKAYIVC
jgi:transposase-like protein